MYIYMHTVTNCEGVRYVTTLLLCNVSLRDAADGDGVAVVGRKAVRSFAELERILDCRADDVNPDVLSVGICAAIGE